MSLKVIKRGVIWLMHVGSWILALYLFATGHFWGGVGAAGTSFVMLATLALLAMVWAAPDLVKAKEEGIRKARQEGYDEEKRRLRSA